MELSSSSGVDRQLPFLLSNQSKLVKYESDGQGGVSRLKFIRPFQLPVFDDKPV